MATPIAKRSIVMNKPKAILNVKSMNARWFIVQQSLLVALLLMVLVPSTWQGLFVLLPSILVWRAIKQRWAHLDLFFAVFGTVFVVNLHLLSAQIGLPSGLLFLVVSVFIIQFLSFVFYQRVCQFNVFKPNMASKPLVLNVVLLMLMSTGILMFDALMLNYPLAFSTVLFAAIVLLIASQLKVILYRTKKIQ
jgi:hypothetical protein